LRKFRTDLLRNRGSRSSGDGIKLWHDVFGGDPFAYCHRYQDDQEDGVTRGPASVFIEFSRLALMPSGSSLRESEIATERILRSSLSLGDARNFRYFHIPRNIVDALVASDYLTEMSKKLGLQKLALRLEALGDATRLKVYRTLVRAGDAGLPVGHIQERTGVPRSTLSHHLHRLIGVGLVSQERQGTTLICRTNYTAMQQTLDELQSECCADSNSGASKRAA
jgi:ArsR family transcriptional regulator, arsenate/arsenite/antimonite-responsive transcriptional repressor